MSWESSLVAREKKRLPLSDSFPCTEFIAHDCFLTREGDVGIAVGVKPAAFETLTPAEVDSVARQFQQSINRFGSKVTIYQIVVKRPNPDIPSRDPESPRSQFIAKQKKTGLFSLEFCFVFIMKRKHVAKNEADINREIATHAWSLSVAVAGAVNMLAASFDLHIMPKDEYFGLQRRLANPSKSVADAVALTKDWDVNEHISQSDPILDPVMRVGNHYARVMTMKSPPAIRGKEQEKDEYAGTFASILVKLLDVPCQFAIVSQWTRLPIERAKTKTSASKRHYNYQQNEGGQSANGGNAAMTKQITAVEAEMTMEDVHYGEFALTMILYSEDPQPLSDAVDAANTALSSYNGALVEHLGYSAMASWLACFPGNQWAQIRSQVISNQNYADLSFLFAASTGHSWNGHLRDEYLAVVRNNHGQPFYLNLHPEGSETAHTIITGKPGMGKSFLLNFLIENALKYKPRIFIFDIMHGFRAITKRVGGAYFEVGCPESTVTMNPLAMEPTEQGLAFLYTFIRLLIESDGGAPLTSIEAGDLDRQIRNLCQAPHELRRLRNLQLMPSVSARLNKWVTREYVDRPSRVGQFAYLFDNAEDALSLSDVQTFNFPRFKDSPEAMEALMFYVIHWVTSMIESDDPRRPKFVVMDEALQFLTRPEIADYVKGGLQRGRHFNWAFVLAAQNLAGVDGPVGQAVLEMCATKIFGPNPSINVKEWAAKFGMSEEQAALITTLTPRKQFLIQDVGIINLDVDQDTVALYSSGAKGIELRNERGER